MNQAKRGQVNVTCEVCGNNQNPCFEVLLGGESHVFDTFECAMRAFSPRCGYCDTQLVGHGIVLGNTLYCSYQCAQEDSAREQKRLMLREQSDL